MARNKELVQAVGGEEEWQKLLGSKHLLVVDLHKTWCGPCSVIEPMQRRLYNDINAAEERLKFLSVDTSLGLADCEQSESCKPRFKLFRDGKVVALIEGADAASLQSSIMKLLPPVPESSP